MFTSIPIQLDHNFKNKNQVSINQTNRYFSLSLRMGAGGMCKQENFFQCILRVHMLNSIKLVVVNHDK